MGLLGYPQPYSLGAASGAEQNNVPFLKICYELLIVMFCLIGPVACSHMALLLNFN